MKSGIWSIIFMLIVLLSAACGPTTSTPTPLPGPSQVWILTPNSGAMLPLAPVGMKFEGASFVGISEFDIQVDGNAEASVAPSSSGSCGANCGTKFYGEYLWTPPGVGVFTITLRALGNGQYSPPTEVEVTISNTVAEGNQPKPVIPTPTLTPLPKLPEIIPEKVFVIGLKNGNCREGGGNQYNIIDGLMKDQSVEAVARSEDGLYVEIIGPNWGNPCWIWAELVQAKQGDIKKLPIGTYPLLPESEPAQPKPGSSRPQPTATPAGRP